MYSFLRIKEWSKLFQNIAKLVESRFWLYLKVFALFLVAFSYFMKVDVSWLFEASMWLVFIDAIYIFLGTLFTLAML